MSHDVIWRHIFKMSWKFSMKKVYFHKEDMWIEELLEHDRPISIRFRDIRKTDASGSIRPSGIYFLNISEMVRCRAVIFQEFLNPHVPFVEIYFYCWKIIWHLDNMTSYDVMWHENAVKLWKTTISQHTDMTEKQIKCWLLCSHVQGINWLYFRF